MAICVVVYAKNTILNDLHFSSVISYANQIGRTFVNFILSLWLAMQREVESKAN